MAESKMKQIAQLLGVELGEEFKIKDNKGTYKLTDSGLLEVFDIVNSQQKIGEWILCSEQLPERYKNVLVYWRRFMSDDCYIDILFMNENNEFLNDFRKINGVPLAWMPLPEPFKG